MLMAKQVFVGFQDNRLLSPVSVFFISKVYERFGESVAVGAVEQTLKVLLQAGTGFHRSQMLLTEGNGTQTIRSRRGSDTAELCTTCPCTLRAPSNIEAFPSAIVESLKITALGEESPTTIPSPQRADGRPRLRSERFRTASLVRVL